MTSFTFLILRGDFIGDNNTVGSFELRQVEIVPDFLCKFSILRVNFN